ncbi:hypothetical protein [Motiliproteus sp. SC1-56]|uniref:hypothetical protein n=1 Tax=Motiliproteus sp. SC1-56 TaxID=2799565 RepID=UPI001A8E3D57|nr:hypothetical protein [Motiliproteus sp. SC1-56]
MVFKRLGWAFAVLLLAGCGAQPFDYQSDREIPAGPGLVSGQDGVFGQPPRRAE